MSEYGDDEGRDDDPREGLRGEQRERADHRFIEAEQRPGDEDRDDDGRGDHPGDAQQRRIRGIHANGSDGNGDKRVPTGNEGFEHCSTIDVHERRDVTHVSRRPALLSRFERFTRSSRRLVFPVSIYVTLST